MTHRVLTVALLCLWCAIGAACRREPETPPAGPATFTKDVAPIMFTQCASCHRAGGDGPFPLLTYADVSRRADEVVEETRARHMPPWLPEPGEFPIVGERRLSASQIGIIERWVAAGKPEGDAVDLPAMPVWPDGWQLGPPDAIVTTPKPYIVQPGGEDIYRNLVLRTGLPSGVFVRAVEFRTNGAHIHHAVVRVDPTVMSRRHDGQDGQPGFDGMAWQNAQDPDGHFIGWAPGRGPIVSPEGMPWRLERGTDLVVELHVIPSDKPFSVAPSVGLYFTSQPPARTPVTAKMSYKLLDIPAGASDYVATSTYELPVAVELMSLYPHAHYLGKEMLVTAALPAGDVKTLLRIPRWNFHFQQDYRFVSPVPLPRGTKITMRYTFDNSTANEDNPRLPPVRVRLGPKSTDEMAELNLQVLTASAADRVALLQYFETRLNLANVELGEMRVREEPANSEYRAFLGASYIEMGRYADAVPHLEEAIRLDSGNVSAHGDLGAALLEQGRVNDALAHLRRAVALAPRNELMQFNLGNALGAASRDDEAAAAYRRALALNPDLADAHVNLGSLLFSRGRLREALPHFERAAELRPDSAMVHSNLGGALAAAGRYPEAMQHVRRALELNPGYGPAMDNLRRLQQMGIK